MLLRQQGVLLHHHIQLDLLLPHPPQDRAQAGCQMVDEEHKALHFPSKQLVGRRHVAREAAQLLSDLVEQLF
jgi:hypothetical protein